MIWTDRARASVVVGCRSCGTRELVNNNAEAVSWGADHLARVHPQPDREVKRAVTASRARQRRSDTR